MSTEALALPPSAMQGTEAWETDVEEPADESSPAPEPLYLPPDLWDSPLQDSPLLEQPIQFQEVVDAANMLRAAAARPKRKRKKRNDSVRLFFYLMFCLFLSSTTTL